MTKPKEKHISDGGIPGLRPLLSGWIQASVDYVERMDRVDCPWHYNEIAVTGFLAAAAWRRNRGVALQEYRTSKGRLLKDRWTGRCDLYTYVPPHAFIFEAKHYRTNIGLHADKPLDRIKDLLALAAREAKQHPASDGHRLGVCFVAPFFSPKKADRVDELLVEWCQRIQTIKHSAIAWTFPTKTRNFRGLWDRIFPGVVALIR